MPSRDHQMVLELIRERPALAADLLEISPKQGVAGWAREPILLGHPGLVLRPLVLGPEEVPVLTDGQAVPVPELAVLSAVVHGPGPDGPKVFEALLQCMRTIDADRAQGLMDEVIAVLPGAARDLLEGMMKTATGEYKSEFFRNAVREGRDLGLREGRQEGRQEGRHEGRVEIILAVLSARGVVVPDEARARIEGCADLDQLVEWGQRAATADSIEDVLG